VIGNRAFHRQPAAVAELAGQLVRGLSEGGMAAVGKHFPGHGYVAADSHLALPQDDRDFETIAAADLLPFAALVREGIAGIMPAHCIYSACDADPAGYSSFWLGSVLRQRLGFQGLIFSDDLGMVGAHGAGDIIARATRALGAGCDMALVCNDRPLAIELLDRGRLLPGEGFAARAEAMRRRCR
jgi:beta-N-acetylhexosaminidase